jgi:RNA polymerase sigma-70 factor (ECF subfamily)
MAKGGWMERRLVERAMRGDEAAFDALVGRVGDQLHSVARRILRDPYLAEDATQRALLDTWQSLPRLRDPDRFEAWAYRLLVNACHAEARRERRHRGNLRLLTSDEPAVPDAAARIATQHQLDRAFRRLGVEHRTVIVLIHYVGLSAAEAAEAMGTPVGTVRSRLHYALKYLREALEADARRERSEGTA